jgi:septal ring-binding cell division protein DamX
VATPERAAEVRKETEQATGAAVLVLHDGPLYKIQLGGFRTRLEADALLRDVQARGLRGAFVVASAPGTQTQATVPGSATSPAAASPAPAGGPAGPPDRPAPGQMVPAQGYRVQIHSVTDRQESQRFFEEARRRLNREDIYLQFEPPFFRVRVGNCRTRDLAEDLARELEQAGYEAPFPVRTQILVPEPGRPGGE